MCGISEGEAFFCYALQLLESSYDKIILTLWISSMIWLFSYEFNAADKCNPWLACNFMEKETLAQLFPCEYCEIFKNTFF